MRAGLLQTRELQDGLQYHIFAPSRGAAEAPVFVTVHGWTRNAREHAELFVPWAEARRVVLVAPLFDVGSFPRYQQLGRGTGAARADHALLRIIEDTGRLTGAATWPLYLFGYSGGGQFVHRFAMAHPEQVARFVVGAAGWYTFPDPAQRFPMGIAPTRSLPGVRFDLHRLLMLPARVLVGELDTHRDHHFNRSRALDVAQGLDRQERGRRWVQAMVAASRARAMPRHHSFALLPAAGHSFRDCMEYGGMGEAVFDFLFNGGGTTDA